MSLITILRAIIVSCFAGAFVMPSHAQTGQQGADSAVMSISAADNGRTIKVRTGQTILVKLPVQRGTGYAWQAPRGDQQALLSISPEKDIAGLPSEPGAKELQVFKLTFSGPGESSLLFQYRRPWDEKSPPAHTIKFKIESQD